MSKIDVSVIVPVYNVRPFVAVLLDSLEATTLQRVEFIIVDDGSTDGSGAVCDDYARRDARFRVVHRPNGGVSAARNAALSMTQGTWIAFADGDDWIAPEALESWLDAARANNLDVVLGNAFRFSGDAPPSERLAPMLSAQPWGQVLSGADWIVRSVARREWPHYVWLQLIRREFIAGLTFREGIVHEDVLWTLALALRAQRIGFDPTPRYGYRTNPDSLTAAPSQAGAVRRADAYLQVVDVIASAAAGAGRHDLRRALQRHAHFELRHLFGLIRKRIADSPERTRLIEGSLQPSMMRTLFGGVSGAHSLWFALRAAATLLVLQARGRMSWRSAGAPLVVTDTRAPTI